MIDEMNLLALGQRLPDWLPRQRWFGGKARRLRRIEFADWAELDSGLARVLLGFVVVHYQSGPSERYFVPLAVEPGVRGGPLGQITLDGSVASLDDALIDPAACRALLVELQRGAGLPTALGGEVGFERGPAFDDVVPPPELAVSRPLGVEQSNSSVVFDNRVVLKCYRRVYDGPNPDLEVPRFLATRTGFAHIPRLAGAVEYRGPRGERASLAMLQEFAHSEGDGWSYLLRRLEQGDAESSSLLAEIQDLGEATADLHLALASASDDPDFAPLPASAEDYAAWQADVKARLASALDALRQAGLDDPLACGVLAAEGRLLHHADLLRTLTPGALSKIRFHGDFHLGQVLKTEQGWLLLDFEGEPLRPLDERRARGCALQDVAGMLRSVSYLRQAALRSGIVAEDNLAGFEASSRAAYVRAYFERAGPSAPFLPGDLPTAMSLLSVFELSKAGYELQYELNNRPDWVQIPLRALSTAAEHGTSPNL